jgi:hypothetical protein
MMIDIDTIINGIFALLGGIIVFIIYYIKDYFDRKR